VAQEWRVSPNMVAMAPVPVALVFSQLFKLGTGLLESGRHYLAASRAFIAGICDLVHLGPPEPMMAVGGGYESG
jgi:Arf-GAP/coiled-coil/ANK repeat/PH domain-containing protein